MTPFTIRGLALTAGALAPAALPAQVPRLAPERVSVVPEVFGRIRGFRELRGTAAGELTGQSSAWWWSTSRRERPRTSVEKYRLP